LIKRTIIFLIYSILAAVVIIPIAIVLYLVSLPTFWKSTKKLEKVKRAGIPNPKDMGIFYPKGGQS